MQIVWRRGVSEQPDMMEDVHITVMTVVPLTAPSLRPHCASHQADVMKYTADSNAPIQRLSWLGQIPLAP